MARFHSCKGFGLVENLVVVSLMSIGVLFAMPFAGTMIRRAEGVGAINTIRATLASARLQAVKAGANVVVVISKSANNAIHLETFRDKASLTATSGTNDGDCVQESGEPSLNPVDIDTHVHFWKYGGAKDDLATAAAFDGYIVNDVVNADLTNRIVFLPTGGIAAPKNANSGPPQPTSPFGRGLYFADSTGKNYFRITMSNTIASGARVDKYVPGQGYVSGAWGWQ
jgi:type II secretory pathway pseudopilin PulG